MILWTPRYSPNRIAGRPVGWPSNSVSDIENPPPPLHRSGVANVRWRGTRRIEVVVRKTGQAIACPAEDRRLFY